MERRERETVADRECRRRQRPDPQCTSCTGGRYHWGAWRGPLNRTHYPGGPEKRVFTRLVPKLFRTIKKESKLPDMLHVVFAVSVHSGVFCVYCIVKYPTFPAIRFFIFYFHSFYFPLYM